MMHLVNNFFRLKHILFLQLVFCAFCQMQLLAQTVTVKSSISGTTPRVIGLNSGNYIPGSNTTTWWKWTGVNGARVFTSAPRIEPTDDIAPHGDGVTNADDFAQRKALLRSNPTDPQYINFSAFKNQYEMNESGFINYDLAYGEFAKNGIKPLAMIGRTESQYPFAEETTTQGWADRWEHWQHYYAQAYYLGSNYGVERYSMYNEPDASNLSVTQEDFLLRLQLASDAIQSAVADVNRDFSKQLKPQVLAPITAGGSKDYLPRLDNSDTRDDIQGWGEVVIKNLNTNYLGVVDPSFQLVHTYAYQQYEHDGRRYAQDLSEIQQYVAEDISEAGFVGEVDFGLTEFNVHTNGVFATRPDDLNSPSRYARLGGIFTGLANQQPEELFLFKFSSNAEDSFLQKNAIFHNSRFDAPYNIGGATSAAGVLKLFTKGFAGSKDLLAEPTHSISNLDIAASYSQQKDYYYLLSANESSNDRSLNFDLSAWNLEPGTIVQVERVAEGHLAEVTQRIVVPQNMQISLAQTGNSVLLLSAPGTAPDGEITLHATDDATVRAGNNLFQNYGSSSHLYVRNVTNGPDGRSASLLQFDTTSLGSSSIERAVLQLHGEVNEGDADSVIAHVYGILDDNWNESSISWRTTTNLDIATGPANLIAHNFISGINSTAEFVGHLSVGQSFGEVNLDVTDFLLSHPDQNITFLIAREVRFDGEDVDRSAGAIRFDSKDNISGLGPKLLIEYREPLPGDYDNNGLVNLDDYNIWQSTYGSSQELIADGNGDGVIDGADYTIWKDAFSLFPEESIEQSTTLAQTRSVPEPSTPLAIVLAWTASLRTNNKGFCS